MSTTLWTLDQVAAVSWAMPLSAGTVALVSPWGRRLAWRVGAIDRPDARKIHRRATPRLGGLSAAVAVIVCAGIWFAADPTASEQYRCCWGLFPGAAIMLGIGLLDDLYGLGPRVKLVFQFAAAGIIWLGGVRIEVLELPLLEPIDLGGLGPALTVLWIVGVTNALNFLDGLDGLAAGTAALVSASFLLFAAGRSGLTPMLGMLGAAMIGACAVLVVHNVRSPKSFLGDSGSLLLGVLVASMGILASQNADTSGTRLCLPGIALAVPLIDVTACVARRLLVGRSVFAADRGHIHHMLLSFGFSANAAAAILCGATAALGGLAATSAYGPAWVEAAALAVILGVSAVVYRWLGYLSVRLWLHCRRANRSISTSISRSPDERTAQARPGPKDREDGDDLLPERLRVVLSRIRRARRALGIDYIRVQRTGSGGGENRPSEAILEWGTRPDNVVTTHLYADDRYGSEALTVTLGERLARRPGRIHAKELLMTPLLTELAAALRRSRGSRTEGDGNRRRKDDGVLAPAMSGR